MTEMWRARTQTSRAQILNPVAVLSHPSHHPQVVLLTQFSLFVYNGGLNPFHFISQQDADRQPRYQMAARD